MSVERRAGPTHAGAVVVRNDGERRSYLLVGPRSHAAEWLLPKGHIEAGESADVAAAREAAEEGATRAAVIAPLGESEFEVGDKHARTTYYLAVHLCDTEATEDRARIWLPMEEAARQLTHDSERRLLEKSDRMVNALWPSRDSGRERFATTLHAQLQFLHDRMKETSDTANQFLNRYMFGGMLAVIALLNVDLILLKQRPDLRSPAVIATLVILAAVILFLAWRYFSTVAAHYTSHRVSHRKLKFKYEVTLHALLGDSTPAAYADAIEKAVDRDPIGEPRAFPRGGSFEQVNDYLLDHHRRAWKKKLSGSSKKSSAKDADSLNYTWIALVLVILTMVVRIAGLIMTPAPTTPSHDNARSDKTSQPTRE